MLVLLTVEIPGADREKNLTGFQRLTIITIYIYIHTHMYIRFYIREFLILGLFRDFQY